MEYLPSRPCDASTARTGIDPELHGLLQRGEVELLNLKCDGGALSREDIVRRVELVV
jgi:hypothetical protein